jgi:hypothetical protein
MEAIRFRPTEALENLMLARDEVGDLNTLARRDLQRYYVLMQHTPMPLTPQELTAVLDTCMSTLFDSDWSIRYFHYGIIDACNLDGLHTAHGLDKDAFLAKISALTITERCVVVDAVERERVRILKENLEKAEA